MSSEDWAKHCFKDEWTLADANFSAGPCLNDDLVADGYCDDDTNNLACNYDGGDCCGFEVLEDYCDDCDCLEGWDVDEGQKLLLFFDWLTPWTTASGQSCSNKIMKIFKSDFFENSFHKDIRISQG